MSLRSFWKRDCLGEPVPLEFQSSWMPFLSQFKLKTSPTMEKFPSLAMFFVTFLK